jgi:hypothetical protein
LEDREQAALSEQTSNTYLHKLDRNYDWLRPGTFSDKHEDFQDDRNDHFLPKEEWCREQGPNFLEDKDDSWHKIDDVEAFDEAFFSNPKLIHNILGGDGKINPGGQFHPDNNVPFCLSYPHGESCFPACEVRQKGWQGEKQIVCDKKRPSMLHASFRVCRYGNGTLCSEPNAETGFIWPEGPGGLEKWYKKYNAGQAVALPSVTDVFQ